MLMVVLRQTDGSVHQGETKRQEREAPRFICDENRCKLGVIEVNPVNETEMWDAGG